MEHHAHPTLETTDITHRYLPTGAETENSTHVFYYILISSRWAFILLLLFNKELWSSGLW
jgi:hypothetical protein